MSAEPVWPADQVFDPNASRIWLVGSMRDRGLARGDVDSREWAKPSRGVRLWLPPGPREPDDRVYAAAAALSPGSVIGGWAAAWSHGVTWADGLSRDGMPIPVTLVIPPEGFVPRGRGIRGRRSELTAIDVDGRHGLPVTSAIRTAFDLARWSRSLDDAVAWLDAMCQAGPVDLAALAAYVAQHKGWVGVGRVRDALELVNPRAKSPQESRLRVAWHLADLPTPLVNVSIWRVGGGFVGEADLLDPESGFVGEYDGWLHRRRDRRELDHGRRRRFGDAGLTMRTYVDRDLASSPLALQASLRSGHAAALTVTRRLWTLEPA